jgi:hypothetical protein
MIIYIFNFRFYFNLKNTLIQDFDTEIVQFLLIIITISAIPKDTF